MNRLLRRIGLTAVPSADAAGLRTVHRAFVSRVPYEDLAVQLGESGPLDPHALIQRVLGGGRGGYCFENNTVLHALLAALGFAVKVPADSHLCCGSAGTYSVLQPALANELRDRKLGNLKALAAECIVSANIGCIQHLQSGTTLPVRHWIEVLDEALSEQPAVSRTD